VFPVSRYTKEILASLGVEERRTRVLGNGTDPIHFRPENVSALRKSLGFENRTIVLSVGRLVRRKGVDIMLDAMPQVLEHFPDALYVVIGQGPERQRLKSQSRRLGLVDSVLFLAERHPDELRHWFNLSDVFVLPTRNLSMDVEGFGLVFLEAAACEKPVVGTLSGGVSDAVLDGETGLLVPSESPAALSRAVVRLLTDADEAKRMGKAGRRRVLSIANWDHVALMLFGSISRSLEDYRIKEDLARTRPLPFSFFRF
jgi:phosphatidylinositol alpha-1,6-mannosyltransferase